MKDKPPVHIFSFEQAWNVYDAALGTLLGGITAAQAARNEIPDGMNYAKLIRMEIMSPMARQYGYVQRRAVSQRGPMQGSAPIYELAERYIKRNNEKRWKVERS